mgnify:FL=1
MQGRYTEIQAMREEIEDTQSEVVDNRVRCIKLLDMLEDLTTRVEKLEDK